MKQLKTLLLGSALMTAASAWALPITTAYDHDYGSAAGKFTVTGGNYTYGTDHVTVSDSRTPAFLDNFDFSSYTAITNIVFSITFAGTNGRESWTGYVNESNTTGTAGWGYFALASTNGNYTQTYEFNTGNNASYFSDLVSAKKFYFKFDETTAGADSFQLYDAKLTVTGTLAATRDSTVPEPASLALLGLGLAGMGVVRRRKQRPTA